MTIEKELEILKHRLMLERTLVGKKDKNAIKELEDKIKYLKEIIKLREDK